ncbi:OLC1v1034847C1 [Oldenlandia corymbosa var. corymbosa]|uniref:OLC1v1034847C1 n=1 Tax=Oldenlandia corymbosa var. corymbosa TaxID=529605 RepID=A0AAV1CSA1_OLDCO|nr:OLC1v1034847C1 [Oldenlandia corymbosa var. corymbosa]
MGAETWSLTAKPCDSCKSTSASVFCRADSAFLCMGCDSKIHAANKLASRHGRVWVCEVCEQAPAIVTCKADAAALCAACDRDIHSANPLARRHERLPVVPFFDSAAAARCNGSSSEEKCFLDVSSEAEEAEAASWLLPNPKDTVEPDSPEYKTADYLFSDMDPYLDINMISGDQKPNIGHYQHHDHLHQNTDGVVPVQSKNDPTHFQGPVVDGFPTYDMDFTGSKPYMYNFSSQSISQSVSSSSMEVGVVPDHNAMADVSTNFGRSDSIPSAISGVDREARVLRYREKRKNRKFEKTIRYASRKAYAETRPRIKGRFAKRTEVEIESLLSADASYGVVPSF